MKFGIGVGSLILILNVVLIGGYTFGCHSCATSSAAAWISSRASRCASTSTTA